MLASPEGVAAATCTQVVKSYTATARAGGAPGIFDDWLASRSAKFAYREHEPNSNSDVAAEILCNADGSFEEFDITVTWPGQPPVAMWVASELALEGLIKVLDRNATIPNFLEAQAGAFTNAQTDPNGTGVQIQPVDQLYESGAITVKSGVANVTYFVRRAR